MLRHVQTAEDGRLSPPDEFDVSLAVSAMARMVERIEAGNGYTLCYSPVMSFFSDKDDLYG